MRTPEQVDNPTSDQKLAIGKMEAERIRARQHLMDRAGLSRGRDVVAGVLMGAAVGLAMFSLIQPKALAFSIIALTGLVGVHIAGINQRFDALLQLLHRDPSGLAAEQHRDAQQRSSQNAAANSEVMDEPPSPS
jgi:xanthosine utilization system XapX-like protein